MIAFGTHYLLTIREAERAHVRGFCQGLLGCELHAHDHGVTADIPPNIDLFHFAGGHVLGVQYVADNAPVIGNIAPGRTWPPRWKGYLPPPDGVSRHRRPSESSTRYTPGRTLTGGGKQLRLSSSETCETRVTLSNYRQLFGRQEALINERSWRGV